MDDRQLQKSNNPALMVTARARNFDTLAEIQKLSVPPGFVSRTAFILKRTASTEARQKPAPFRSASVLTPLSSHEFSSLEENVLEANMQVKHRAWIIHDHLDHHVEEPDDEPSHKNVTIASEGRLPKGLIWGCSACSNCLKVPAQWDPEGACSVSLEDAPLFQPTDEEFKDTFKYIESICQQVKPYGLCRIVPPPSWQPPGFIGENNACEGFNFSTEVQRINDFRNYSKRKGLASRNLKESKRRRISKLDLDTKFSNGNTINFEVVGSPQVEQSEIQSGPHFTVESFKKNADYFKECYFSKKSKVLNPEASPLTCHERWEPSEEDIEGEYWRILEKPTAEIDVLCRANLDAESLRNRLLDSQKTETSNSISDRDSGWDLSNLSKLPGSLLSFENSDCLGDLAPRFHIGMCFSTLPWKVEEHHLYALHCLHLGAPKIWYGVPGHYFSKFQAAVKKHFPDNFVQRPELLQKLAMQVSPSTLQAEGIPVYRCIQRPKEFILFLPGTYHTGFDCGFNISESVCCAPLDWLPYGQSVTELYRGKQMKQLISYEKLLIRAAHEAVKARWEFLLKGNKSPANIKWKDACGKGRVIAETLKACVKSEARQREYLCTESQSRKMNKCFDAGARKECYTCNSILYLSAAFCACNPNKYACLKHTKNLCPCAWSKKVFLLRFNISDLNVLVEATEGKFFAINKWIKENVGNAMGYDTAENAHVIPLDESSNDKALDRKGESSVSSVDCTSLKDATEKLVSETMARILKASSVGGSQSKFSDAWASSVAVDLSDSSSESDGDISVLPFQLKEKKPLAESHVVSNAQATGSSEVGRDEKQETKKSAKSETIICLSSDDDEHSHPSRGTRGVSLSLAHVSASLIEKDDILDVPSRDLSSPTLPIEEEVATMTLPDCTASVVLPIGQGQSQCRSRGLNHNRIEELKIVNGRLQPSGPVSRWSTYVITNQPDAQASEFMMASPETRARWFASWKEHFRWDESQPDMHPNMIRKLWEKQAARRYNDLVGKARAAGKCPKWLDTTVWDLWVVYWNTAEFKAKSKQQRANRYANPSVHTSGSRSHWETRRLMDEQLGRPVTPLELHIETHTHGTDKQFVDQRSSNIAARSREILTQKSSQSGILPSFQDECDAYLEAVGGVGPGGAVYGLGSATSEYFNDRIGAPRKEAFRIVKMQRENDSLRAEVAELRANQAVQIQALQQFMEEMRANRALPSMSTTPALNNSDQTD